MATRPDIAAVDRRGIGACENHGEQVAMLVSLLRIATIAFILLPLAALGEPIKLKLAYYSSDQTRSYSMAVKAFVDAVNADAQGGLTIEVYTGGLLGKDSAQQAQLVRDGKADMAYVVLGATASQFPDHEVVELPGLFRDMREATRINSRILDSGIVGGYDDFFVVASLATEPEGIHTRVPIASLADLRGKRIRANNPIEASALAMLGMSPVVLPIVKTPEAISRGTIDGAATALGPLTDFGLGRVVTFHYFLRLGASVRSLLMSRKTFMSLPKAGQDVIRKYSGSWLTDRFIDGDEAYNTVLIEQLKADPLRTVIFPSQPDIEVAKEAFRALRAEWAEAKPHNRLLLDTVEAEVSKYRSDR
jgi:TRAP-type C4-dicarboxylate transport system substrate-binding protein